MKTLLITLLLLTALALLLGIAGFFGAEFILLSVLVAIAAGIVLIPTVLGLNRNEEDHYYPTEH